MNPLSLKIWQLSNPKILLNQLTKFSTFTILELIDIKIIERNSQSNSFYFKDSLLR